MIVLWIRIRMDPKILPVSGSGIIVLDPDTAKYERADKLKCSRYFSVNSRFCVLYVGLKYVIENGK